MLVKAVTEVTPGSDLGHLVGFHLALHLFSVRVVAMRETPQTKLNKPYWEFGYRSFARGRLVTNCAHLAFGIGEVFRVTLYASRVTGQDRR